MIALLILVGYVLNFFFNRWLFFQIQRVDGSDYVNPVGVFSCYLSLIGTIVLTLIYLMDRPNNFNFFKYKGKKTKKQDLWD